MAFRPVQWSRQTIEGRQIESDGSRLLNFYAVASVGPDSPKVPVVIYGAPGYRRFARVPAQDFNQGGRTVSPPPGIYGLLPVDTPVYGKRLFGVSAQYQLFEIRLSGGAHMHPEYRPIRKDRPDPLYVLPADQIRNFTTEPTQRATDPVHMVQDGRRVMFVSDREVFMWDMKTDSFVSLQAPTPTDLSAALPDEDWVDCEWIDGYFLLAARSGQFFHSLLRSEQFDQLDFAFASSKPDGIVGIRAFARRIYVFGTETIEQWANTGDRDFAFRRDNSFNVNVGCAALATIRADQERIFFLGSDRIVHAIRGSSVRRISNESVEYDLGRADIQDSRAFTYTQEGHRFYSLTIHLPDEPADREWKNWTIDTTTSLWHERTLVDVMDSTVFQGRQIIARSGSDLLAELALDLGDHDGQPAYREAVAPALYANQQRAQIHSFEVDISKRAALTYGIAQDRLDLDRIEIDWSDDAKTTWKNGGRAPRYLSGPRHRWQQLGQLKHTGRNFRLKANSHRPIQIFGAYIRDDVDED